MAKVAHLLIDTVLQRVRDPQGLAHTRAQVLDLLSQCQRFINGALGLVLTTTTLTTLPRKLLYTLSGDLTTTLRVVAVRDGARDLAKMPTLASLNHVDLHWMRLEGARFEAWVPIGRDLLVIYPAKEVGSTVTVVHASLTSALTGEDDVTEIPDEYLDMVVTLCEAIVLLIQRDLASADAAMKRLGQSLQLDVSAYRLHLPVPDGQAGAVRT